MKYFDFQGEKISRLGFGLMRLPVIDGDQSNIDYDKVEKMFLYAYENGVNYYDTAFPYHNGFSEKTLGKLLTNNHMHGKVNIATKLFTLVIRQPDFDPRKMLDEQLSRLQSDHIDFYLMHGLNKDQWDYLCEHFDIKNYLRDLKRQGVLRHLGFSFHDTYESFTEIINDFEWEFAQIQYNYLDKDIQAGDRGREFALSKGVPLNVMEPCKGGSLIFPNYPEIDEIKAKHGLADISNAELAFSYVFDKPGFMVVLSGMNEMEQLEENIRIANKYDYNTFSAEAEAAVEEIRDLIEHS
ncbi:MAG: aldo/keto reductase, partial [Oscillospiraceae bacterium]|nr:aldo/keto reductase [Oscillospiraceae bacterium]